MKVNFKVILMTVVFGVSTCVQAMDMVEIAVKTIVPVVSAATFYSSYQLAQTSNALAEKYKERNEPIRARIVNPSLNDGMIFSCTVVSLALLYLPTNENQKMVMYGLSAAASTAGVACYIFNRRQLIHRQKVASAHYADFSQKDAEREIDEIA